MQITAIYLLFACHYRLNCQGRMQEKRQSLNKRTIPYKLSHLLKIFLVLYFTARYH